MKSPRLCRKLLAALVVSFGVLAQAGELEVRISHRGDGAPLWLDSLRYAAPGEKTASVTRLSYLLSGFALQRTDGAWSELPAQFAWIDVARGSSSFALREIPAGGYRALRFAIGLDAVTDAGDPARWAADHPLNPNLNRLHWSWQGGYIFLALEGHLRRGNDDPRGFSFHFAREPNCTVVEVPLQLESAPGGAPRVQLEFAVVALLRAALAAGESTHSRDGDPVAAAMRSALTGAFSVREIVRREAPRATERVGPIDLPAAWTAFPFRMNRDFPVPALPRDNPLLVERVELGRRLFHEPLLSRTGAISCASCHDPARGFSDPRPRSLGVDGRPGRRQSMPLFNLAWKTSFFWDGRAPSLRKQVLMPIRDHIEMDERLDRVTAKLTENPDYPALFAAAFGRREITPERLALALENFLLTLASGDSKFDRARQGRAQLSDEEQRGSELFFTEFDPRLGLRGADCFHCHGGALFSDFDFHNNGLGDPRDAGRFMVTREPRDRGKFATPSLRNVALTPPYMHDGRFATLEEVVAHYAGGVQRSATLDPNLAKHPVGGLPLSAADQRALVAFLQTLTDEKLGVAVASAERRASAR